MEKLLLLALSFALLTGCEQDTTTPDTTTPDDTSVTTPEVEAQTPDVETPDVDFDDDVSPEINPNYLESTELSLQFADIIWEARDEEANQFMPIITSPADPMGEYIFPQLGFDPELVEGFAFSVSAMMTQAYGIGIVKPTDGNGETLLEGLKGFAEIQVQNFTNYLPDQLEIAQSAKVEALEDGTLVMVICADHDAIFDSIVASLGQ